MRETSSLAPVSYWGQLAIDPRWEPHSHRPLEKPHSFRETKVCLQICVGPKLCCLLPVPPPTVRAGASPLSPACPSHCPAYQVPPQGLPSYTPSC